MGPSDQYGDAVAWLADFLRFCETCTVDAVAFVSRACDIDVLKQELDLMRQFKKPIWLVSFHCGKNANDFINEVTQEQYVEKAIRELELDVDVAMYAWRSQAKGEGSDSLIDSSLIDSNGDLTGLGRIYTKALFASVATFNWPPQDEKCLMDPRCYMKECEPVKGIRYIPHLMGITTDDPYNNFHGSMWKRDLHIISSQIGANAVRLKAPDIDRSGTQSWNHILNDAHHWGLRVIPTFSLEPLLYPMLELSYGQMERQAEDAFSAFLYRFVINADQEREAERRIGGNPCDSTGGSMHPSVSSWSIGGLPILEELITSAAKLKEGFISYEEPVVAVRLRLNFALRILKRCMQSMFPSESAARRKISLAVPLRRSIVTMDTPLFLTQLEEVMESLENREFEGSFFDEWILETIMPPVPSAMDQVIGTIFNLSRSYKVKKIDHPSGWCCGCSVRGGTCESRCPDSTATAHEGVGSLSATNFRRLWWLHC
jgi:hypothetical protein